MRQQDQHQQTRDEHPEVVPSGPVPPANQPTAFGAATVGGAAAAAALASDVPADERDAREDDTVQPGDGAVEDIAVDRPGQRGLSPTEETIHRLPAPGRGD